MSYRLIQSAIQLPSGVKAELVGGILSLKGPKGELKLEINTKVPVQLTDEGIKVSETTNDDKAIIGTTCALIKNNIIGVDKGFEKTLELVGVGYRASMKGSVLHLTLGYSHPIDFTTPEGITIETPSQTEIIIKGSDKQKVGQVAAKIRSYREPECYKGKGVKYKNERISIKEAKKK